MSPRLMYRVLRTKLPADTLLMYWLLRNNLQWLPGARTQAAAVCITGLIKFDVLRHFDLRHWPE